MLLILISSILVLGSSIKLSDTGIGVCYYPEHWPQSKWQQDAKDMAQLGIQTVRIAEFMWEIVNPKLGVYNWTMLDQAIEILAAEGLKIVLGTPTANPPKWMVDMYTPEEFLPFGIDGRPRKFGSRRHYSFSSPIVWNHASDIVEKMAQRYGNHPAVYAWQLDNEYGCHDTVRTYDPNALVGFRKWLAEKYDGNINALNEAWGNVFWSMNYDSFDQIDLPNLAVTELNPAHRLDFYRYSSDQVVAFNNMQVSILRKYTKKPLTTNFMGFFFQFDAFKLSESLDFATWDSYPLGFTDTTLGLGDIFTEDEKIKYSSTGHPDLASFHHDLYKSVGKGRFWIMEQQPGPVNWGDHNPSPSPNMVKLWSIEAAAHGADIVSYFRWRQVPFGQEQMHSGLHRGDYEKDTGYFEAQSFMNDIHSLSKKAGNLRPTNNQNFPKALLLFSFESQWIQDIEPQSKSYSFVAMLYNFYSSFRSVGYEIDFMSVERFSKFKEPSALNAYKVVIVPGLSTIPEGVAHLLEKFSGDIVFGPRTGSKTSQFQNPASLAPDQPLQKILLPMKITRVESLRPGVNIPVKFTSGSEESESFYIQLWREKIELISSHSISKVSGTFEDDGLTGSPAAISFKISSNLRTHYLAFFPDRRSLVYYISNNLKVSGALKEPIEDFRLSSREGVRFAINYGSNSVSLTSEILNNNCNTPKFVLGSSLVKPHDASAWVCMDSSNTI